MGRRCARIVAFLCFGELLEDSLDATLFISFGVLDFRALIRDRSLMSIFSLSVGDFETMY
jgi:hypothetical protein